MRAILKKITGPFLKKASALYLSKPRKYRYKDISVWVEPSVFPPFITISTKLLLEFTETLSIKNRTFLELGCGCGIISILASKNGAKVTATDINPTALEALKKNAENNNVSIDILHSDLFENLKKRTFDYIIINPPYYPKNPSSIAENAWFCGENFEYFEKLFSELPGYLNDSNEVYMILSEDCKTDHIITIAEKNNLSMKCILKKSVFKEVNFIYRIEKRINHR
ncbi:methyltransferase family protein [Flavobacterium enshiense DK69]|uniref:Methyltransferase n=1 Tax=Flavobacterium enshiense DK69 TaxID=1107311 RepID=V6SAB7_9FLAO|nr:methyltransferase [Flavobacterium enshiense]ESU23152.1 methyltransferase family protein [Flavobacterium enshiense DK69]KGO95987.1 methyltransferase [Flavobacterium enshiense DK69]